MLKEYGDELELAPLPAPWPHLRLPGTESWLTWSGTFGTMVGLILMAADKVSLDLLGKIVLGLALLPVVVTAVTWVGKASAVAWYRVTWYSRVHQKFYGLYSQFQKETQFAAELSSLLTSLKHALTIFPLLGSVEIASKVYLRIEKRDSVLLPNSSLIVIFDFNSGTILGKFQIISATPTEYRADLVEVREGQLWWGRMVQQAKSHEYTPVSEHIGAILIPQEADRDD